MPNCTPKRPLTRTLPWLFALSLSVSWATAQAALPPRLLEQLAPAESFLLLGFNSPFGAPETGLQTDLDALDFPRGGRTLTKLGELSSDPTLRDLLGEYGSFLQGVEGQLGRQQERMRSGDKFTRCYEANLPDNLEELAASIPDGESSALLSVGSSSYSPIPAVTALLRVAPEAEAQTAEAQRLVVLCSERVGAEVVRLREGKTTLFVVNNGGDFPFVLSRVGTLFIAGTNPEAVRGVVRRAHGSDEPNLSTTDFYQQNQELLAGPGMSLALDAAALGNTVESLGGGFAGAQTRPLLGKLVSSLRTLGSYAGVLRFEGQELRLSSRLNVNPRGGDAELAALLLGNTPAPAPTLAPAGSTAVSTSYWQPQRVLAYVEGWAELAGQATGEPVSLQNLAQQELGLNLDTALGWLGDETTSVVLKPIGTDVGTLVYGRPQVMAFTTTSRRAAEAGLQELGQALLRGLESQNFTGTDLPAGSVQVAQSSYRFGDTEITRFRVGPTFDLGTAFLGDTLLVGTPTAALEDVITTARGLRRPMTDDETYKQSQTGAPQGAVSSSYQDLSAELRGYAELTRVITQPLAFTASVGLSGDANTQAPDFADLLHLLELIPNTLQTFSDHTESSASYTWLKGSARRSETRLRFR